MFRKSGYSRAIAADLGEINHRLRALEASLERLGGRASASAGRAADRLNETVAGALSGIAERFRDGSLRDDAARYGGEAAKEAAKLGNLALRRLSDEVEHRPLVTLAVAVGVGILVGLASSSRR
jgi:ElaB/YqjD/DUF883 family membrane-anchored ribosome-binding protein